MVNTIVTADLDVSPDLKQAKGCSECCSREEVVTGDDVHKMDVSIETIQTSTDGNLSEAHPLFKKISDHLKVLFADGKGLCRICYELVFDTNKIEIELDDQ